MLVNILYPCSCILWGHSVRYHATTYESWMVVVDLAEA